MSTFGRSPGMAALAAISEANTKMTPEMRRLMIDDAMHTMIDVEAATFGTFEVVDMDLSGKTFLAARLRRVE